MSERAKCQTCGAPLLQPHERHAIFDTTPRKRPDFYVEPDEEAATPAARSDAEGQRKAIEESVKLQSHYAELLNMHDGGERLTFASADDWIARLNQLPEAASRTPPALQAIAPEWAEAANLAKGLCESEANKWERTNPKTAEHWRSVAVRLGAIYLTQDHLGAAPPGGEPAQPTDYKRLSELLGRALDQDTEVIEKLQAENAALRAERDALRAQVQRVQFKVMKWRATPREPYMKGEYQMLQGCAEELAEIVCTTQAWGELPEHLKARPR